MPPSADCSYPRYLVIAVSLATGRVLVLGLDHVFDGAALDVTVLSSLHQLRWGPIAGREAMPELWAPAASEPDAPAELRKAADRVAA